MPCFVEMGLSLLHGCVGGEIHYGETLCRLDVGSFLTLLGPMCLCCGLDSALCWYHTEVLPGDILLWRCKMNWSRLASQSEHVFLWIAWCNRS